MASRGRPRGFDTDAALDEAIEVFWRRGYEGASLDELTRSMGITKPSLYAAFGNKEQLFRLAVGRYAATVMSYVDAALSEPTARRVAERFLRENVAAITQPGKPRGCLSIQGGLVASPDDEQVIEFVNQSRAAGEARFTERFRRAVEEGDLDGTDDPADLAKYLNVVTAGLAVQAAAGVAREELARTAERALRAFPVSRHP